MGLRVSSPVGGAWALGDWAVLAEQGRAKSLALWVQAAGACVSWVPSLERLNDPNLCP